MYYLFTKFHDKLSSIFELACYIKWNEKKYAHIYLWSLLKRKHHQQCKKMYALLSKASKFIKSLFIFHLAIRTWYEWIERKGGKCRFFKCTHTLNRNWHRQAPRMNTWFRKFPAKVYLRGYDTKYTFLPFSRSLFPRGSISRKKPKNHIINDILQTTIPKFVSDYDYALQ